MQDAKARIIVVEYKVYVIGRLFGDFDIVLIAWRVFNNLLRSGKNAEKRWDHRLHHIAHFRHYDLAAPFFLVAKGVATIVLRSLRTARRNETVDIIYGVINGRLYTRRELRFGHLLMRIRLVVKLRGFRSIILAKQCVLRRLRHPCKVACHYFFRVALALVPSAPLTLPALIEA